MGSQCGRWQVAFNGEIYNFKELRADLEAKGQTFSSSSDTEVLVAAIATLGFAEALRRLRGMYAIAALDTAGQTIFLARDPFGIKPLYLARWAGGIAFASEMAAMNDLPGVERSLNARACWRYLRYGVTDQGTTTLVEGISHVPAGHWTQVPLTGRLPDSLQYHPHWTTPETCRRQTLSDATDRFRHLFLQAVDRHLRSDVAIGTALSGGLDSSAIVCGIRHVAPELPIHTFSYLADNASLSEAKWIDLVNRHIGAQSHSIRITADDIVRDVSAIIAVQGEPFSSTSILAQYQVFRAAHEQGVKVMLDGQGADELLGGYIWHQGARVAGLVARGRWIAASRLLLAQRRWPSRTSARVAAYAANYSLPQSLLPKARAIAGRTDRPTWADENWFRDRGVRQEYDLRPRECSLSAVLRTDLMERGLAQLLRYEDRNSMAWSVESRVPFLDLDLVEFTLSLPEEFLIADDGTSKFIMRHSLRGIVPDAILNRRDKIGFCTPERDWLGNGSLITTKAMQILMERRIPGLAVDGVRRLFESLESGKTGGGQRADQAWRLINFILWYETIGQSR